MSIEDVSVKKHTIEGCLVICKALAVLPLDSSNLPIQAIQDLYDVIEIVAPELERVLGLLPDEPSDPNWN